MRVVDDLALIGEAKWNALVAASGSGNAQLATDGVTFLDGNLLQGAGITYALASISDTGRAHLEANRETADGILAALEQAGARMAKARAWFYREGDGGGSDIPGVVPAVNEARRALKAAIAERLEASPTTQEEMAAILRDAADAIRALAASGDRED